MIIKIAKVGGIAFTALALLSFAPANASEVTGTLSAGAAAPADGSTAGGTLTGGVGSGNTISGSVSGGSSGSRSSGSSSGGGGGSVLGESIEIAQTTTPGLPNTGGGGSAALSGLTASVINYALFALTAGIAYFQRKRTMNSPKE